MIVGKEAWVLRGGVFAIGAAIAVLGWPSAASANVSCRFSPVDHELTVRYGGVAEAISFVRDDATIRVARLETGRVRCKGGTPTVFNTDSVSIEERRRSRFNTVFIDLRRGAFVPGFTPEAGGDSEIEFTARLGGRLSTVVVGGTDQADWMRFGRIESPVGGDPRMGGNLNASEAQPDIDLRMRGLGHLFVAGFAGADRLSARGGPEFDGQFTARGDSGIPDLGLLGMRGDDVLVGGAAREQVLAGGRHRDRLVGGTQIDYLSGGNARDTLLGGPGPDNVDGGRGRDRIRLGPGNDFVLTVDGFRDRVHCGPGDDRGLADRKDLLRSCPRVKRVRRTGRNGPTARATARLPGLPGAIERWLRGVPAR